MKMCTWKQDLKSILQIGVLGINVVNDTLFEEKKMRVGEPCPATVARSHGPDVRGLIDKLWTAQIHWNSEEILKTLRSKIKCVCVCLWKCMSKTDMTHMSLSRSEELKPVRVWTRISAVSGNAAPRDPAASTHPCLLCTSFTLSPYPTVIAERKVRKLQMLDPAC